MSAWAVDERPWVLHTTLVLGARTERWLDLQAETHGAFGSRLLGLRVAEGATRRPHWLVASDRPALRRAYRESYRSGGLSLRWLARQFRANPPAVVHAHFGTLAAGQRELARACGAPLVASFYGYDATQREILESRRWQRRYRRLFDAVAAVLAEGPAMAARVERLGCPPEKLHVVRLPADEGGLETVERRPPDSFVVVAPGAASEKKGFDVAVEAFARALRGRDDARLVLVGGGRDEETLRGRAAELGVAGQTDFLGSQPFHAFMTAVGGASVALFPSRQARDGDSDGGAPVTLIETQWLGVPVLVSDHDDLPFVAAPGGSRILPPQDVDAWAGALRELYDDPARLEPMGRAAAAFARAEHRRGANLAARESLYGSLT